ncbi:hypothetical protein ES288_D02G286000v1 [Gossypium darwinii]|uniref:BURP domain-containing protein n=1 Tax=Gossypium darwinii TaxID=34276 RepID=A0A5D2DKP4_GOSDA|nr:hypothetical protein ES288_D02G286000v1 [Gossypium darwinii]
MVQFIQCLLFSCLLLLLCGHGINGARDVKPVPVANPQDLDGKFTISDFHKTVNIGSLAEKASVLQGLKIADSIPFSSSKLPQILQLYSIAPGSSLAKSMTDTLPKCEHAPGITNITNYHQLKVKPRPCATSFQSMVDFVSGAFKRKGACHPMLYLYAVFFCQYDEELSERVFKVSMVGENTKGCHRCFYTAATIQTHPKDNINAAAVCHMDSARAALLNLMDKQGKSPMCHFCSAGDLIWFQ